MALDKASDAALCFPGLAEEPSELVAVVPLKFIQGFSTLAHNYSLRAVAPDYYSGVEADAFQTAYARCGADLAKLRDMLARPATVPEGDAA